MSAESLIRILCVDDHPLVLGLIANGHSNKQIAFTPQLR